MHVSLSLSLSSHASDDNKRKADSGLGENLPFNAPGRTLKIQRTTGGSSDLYQPDRQVIYRGEDRGGDTRIIARGRSSASVFSDDYPL